MFCIIIPNSWIRLNFNIHDNFKRLVAILNQQVLTWNLNNGHILSSQMGKLPGSSYFQKKNFSEHPSGDGNAAKTMLLAWHASTTAIIKYDDNLSLIIHFCLQLSWVLVEAKKKTSLQRKSNQLLLDLL